MLTAAGVRWRGAGLLTRWPRSSVRRSGPCVADIARLSSRRLFPDDTSGLSGLYGTPQLVDRLEALCVKNPGIECNIDLYRAIYPFRLDDFQVNGLKALTCEKNVLVCTPTGSGKTVVGELAIYYALMKGRRLIYTTPLKALSNQKYQDFCKRFGEHRVGLHTGDIKLNHLAQIVVMTTEIFRNSLYSRETGLVSDTFAICFDEFHYMNDLERGTVWEECVIACPPDVRIIALSATMGNVASIRDWISTIHGPTELLTSTYRPVPLEYSYFINKRLVSFFADASVGPGSKASQGRTQVVAPGEWQLHPRVVSQARPRSAQKRDHSVDDVFNHTVRPLVQQLQSQQHLPALLFSFSRALCDQLAELSCSNRVQLLTNHEVHRVHLALSRFLQQYPSLPVSKESAQMLELGIATHHAGHVPLWKNLIEQLFQAGLVKVLFCTDTLAAGMNMPARTSVFLSTQRNRKGVKEMLKTSEVLQMAGRAGRRGMDKVGYVVFAHNPDTPVQTLHRILVGEIDEVESKFHMSFGMVRRLVQMRSLADCRALVLRGFGSYLHQAQQQDSEMQASPDGSHRPSSDLDDQGEGEGEGEQVEEEDDWDEEWEDDWDEDWDDGWEEDGAGSGVGKEWDEEWKRVRHGDDYPTAWKRFLRVYRVLHHHQALPGQDNATLGLRITQLTSYNDLWIALIWSEHDLLSCLTPSELAATMATLCMEKKPMGSQSGEGKRLHGYRPSKALRRTFKHIRELRRRVMKLQDAHAVTLPCTFSPVVATSAMQWSEGEIWRDVCQSSPFSQGDLHRAFKQAADLLQQVAKLHEMPKALSAKLRIAIKSLNRFPVSDTTFIACVEESGEAESTAGDSSAKAAATSRPEQQKEDEEDEEDMWMEEAVALGREEEKLLRRLQSKTRKYQEQQVRRTIKEACKQPRDSAAAKSGKKRER